MIYGAGCSGVFSLEELLSVLGTPLEKVSFRHVGKVSSSDAPPCVGYLGHPFLKRGRERSEDRSETVAIFVSHKKYIDLFPRSSLLVGRSQDLRKNAKSSK